MCPPLHRSSERYSRLHRNCARALPSVTEDCCCCCCCCCHSAAAAAATAAAAAAAAAAFARERESSRPDPHRRSSRSPPCRPEAAPARRRVSNVASAPPLAEIAHRQPGRAFCFRRVRLRSESRTGASAGPVTSTRRLHVDRPDRQDVEAPNVDRPGEAHHAALDVQPSPTARFLASPMRVSSPPDGRRNELRGRRRSRAARVYAEAPNAKIIAKVELDEAGSTQPQAALLPKPRAWRRRDRPARRRHSASSWAWYLRAGRPAPRPPPGRRSPACRSRSCSPPPCRTVSWRSARAGAQAIYVRCHLARGPAAVQLPSPLASRLPPAPSEPGRAAGTQSTTSGWPAQHARAADLAQSMPSTTERSASSSAASVPDSCGLGVRAGEGDVRVQRAAQAPAGRRQQRPHADTRSWAAAGPQRRVLRPVPALAEPPARRHLAICTAGALAVPQQRAVSDSPSPLTRRRRASRTRQPPRIDAPPPFHQHHRLATHACQRSVASAPSSRGCAFHCASKTMSPDSHGPAVAGRRRTHARPAADPASRARRAQFAGARTGSSRPGRRIVAIARPAGRAGACEQSLTAPTSKSPSAPRRCETLFQAAATRFRCHRRITGRRPASPAAPATLPVLRQRRPPCPARSDCERALALLPGRAHVQRASRSRVYRCSGASRTVQRCAPHRLPAPARGTARLACTAGSRQPPCHASFASARPRNLDLARLGGHTRPRRQPGCACARSAPDASRCVRAAGPPSRLARHLQAGACRSAPAAACPRGAAELQPAAPVGRADLERSERQRPSAQRPRATASAVRALCTAAASSLDAGRRLTPRLRP